MKFNLHTIILLCGLSCCDKMFYAKNHLIPELRSLENGLKLNIQYLTQNNSQQNILDESKMNLHNPENTHKLEFSLEQQLDQFTSFPNNAEFVIVDTNALDMNFRTKMIEVAQKNHYNIDLLIFDLPTHEYCNDTDENPYNQIIQIKNYKQTLPVTEIVDFDLYKRCHFWEDAVFVGDLHGCLEPLLEIEKVAENLPIIVLGDVIDKGNNSLEMLRHLKEHSDKYPLRILGNHENYVYKYLHDQLAESPKHDYYTSITQYKNNTEFYELIDWYFETAVPFVKVRDSVYVTHAPCENRYIGKIDYTSQRKQQYASVSNEIVKMIRNEANGCFPYHIFGHAAFRQVFEYHNKIGLDTGGVYGNAFSYYMNGKAHSINAKKSYAKYQLLDAQNFEKHDETVVD
jgi:predicted kinase